MLTIPYYYPNFVITVYGRLSMTGFQHAYLTGCRQFKLVLSFPTKKKNLLVFLKTLPKDHYFFFIYINDKSRSSNKFNFRLFADDTNLLYADKHLTLLETLVNNELSG